MDPTTASAFTLHQWYALAVAMGAGIGVAVAVVRGGAAILRARKAAHDAIRDTGRQQLASEDGRELVRKHVSEFLDTGVGRKIMGDAVAGYLDTRDGQQRISVIATDVVQRALDPLVTRFDRIATDLERTNRTLEAMGQRWDERWEKLVAARTG